MSVTYFFLQYGDTPLHTSARYGHAGVIRILVSAKCNPSEQNKNGDTALHIAAAMGRRKLTRVLLESGCNLRVKNKQQETAMEIAQRKSLTDIIQILRDPPPPTHRPSSGNRLNTSHSSGGGGAFTHHHDDDDDIIDEDEILVMEEDVDGQVHRYPEPHQKYKHSSHTAGYKKKPAQPSRHRQHQQLPHSASALFPESRHHHHHQRHRRSKRRHHHRSPYHDGSGGGGGGFEDIVQDLLDEATDVEANHGGQYYLDLAGNVRKGPPAASRRGPTCHCGPIFSKVCLSVSHQVEKRKRSLKPRQK